MTVVARHSCDEPVEEQEEEEEKEEEEGEFHFSAHPYLETL
jgi:hypothetical protein